MTRRALYRHPSESAKHEQIKILFEEYIFHMNKLMANPSRRHAEKARKSLITLKKVAHDRGKELLSLYGIKGNEGKEIINDRHKHRISTADQQDAGRQGQETSTTDTN